MANISTEDRAAIDRLPRWARDLIKRLEIASEPAIEEAAKARKKAEVAEEKARRLSDANAALMELLSVAGRAGVDWAKKVVDVLDAYSIFKEGAK